MGQKTVFFPGPSEVSHNDWMVDSRDLFPGQSVVLRLPKDLILYHLCLLERFLPYSWLLFLSHSIFI